MTLQDLCLDKIVQLFDRFNFAFTTGKDVHVKRRFEFLQRKYSFRILQKLSENNCIKDEHADFLFNRHLKVLDTEWLSYCSWEIVKRKFAEIGPSLQKLCINHEMKDEIKWAKFLRHIPNIKVIWSNGFCDNAFLRGIAQYCHNIETLDIKDSDMVTDHGLKFLCLKKKGKFQCPLLKELYISGTSIEHAGMKYLLQHMPTLERTDYAELDEVLYEIHKNSINALDKVKPYNLTHLDLMHIVYFGHRSDILKISLSVCPRVKVLSCPVFNEEQLKLCSNLIELEVLHLDCYTDTSIEINDFLMLRGNNLVTLGIQKFSLLASVLALNCPCLNVLQMNDVTFQSDDKDSIPMLHNLEELSLENCKFSDTQTSKSLVLLLSSSPNLTQLCFKNCDSFTSEIKTQVLKCCELCQLKQVSFAHSSVEPQLFMDILLTCSSLISMNISGCYVEEDFERDLFRIAHTLPNRPFLLNNTDSLGDLSDSLSMDSDDVMDFFLVEHFLNTFDHWNYDGYDYDDDSDNED